MLLSTLALAQGYDRQDVVRGLCKKDGCDEFVIGDKSEVSKGSDGTLYRTRVRTYHASNKGRIDGGEESGFVYCSLSRPAIISAEEGQPPVAIFLAPDDQSPAHVQRQSTNFYALYFAFCHGIEAGKLAAQDRATGFAFSTERWAEAARLGRCVHRPHATAAWSTS
jgi:hypothetical protein